MHPLMWKPVLEGVILPLRPLDCANYRSIWTPMVRRSWPIPSRRPKALSTSLRSKANVALAMRYGQPSLEASLMSLLARGIAACFYSDLSAVCRLIYGTVTDAFRATAEPSRSVEVRTIRSFPTEPAYIEALARSIEETGPSVGRPDFAAGDRLIASFPFDPTEDARRG